MAGAGRVLLREAMDEGLGAMGTGVPLVTGFLGFEIAAPVFTIGADWAADLVTTFLSEFDFDLSLTLVSLVSRDSLNLSTFDSSLLLLTSASG